MQNAGHRADGHRQCRRRGPRASTRHAHAISSALLEASIEGARGLLLNVAGPSDLGLFEVNEAAEVVKETAHPDANIIFGAIIDDALGDEVRITVIAAGFDRFDGERRRDATRRRHWVCTSARAARPPTRAVRRRPRRARRR